METPALLGVYSETRGKETIYRLCDKTSFLVNLQVVDYSETRAAIQLGVYLVILAQVLAVDYLATPRPQNQPVPFHLEIRQRLLR